MFYSLCNLKTLVRSWSSLHLRAGVTDFTIHSFKFTGEGTNVDKCAADLYPAELLNVLKWRAVQ
jgi:hypothetical protein